MIVTRAQNDGKTKPGQVADVVRTRKKKSNGPTTGVIVSTVNIGHRL
jgi:hypothetical protein